MTNATRPTIVLKLGSSLLDATRPLAPAIQEAYRWHRAGHRVVVVVSAWAGETDRLLADAATIDPHADPHAVAAHVALGEAAAAARFVLELGVRGIPARALAPAACALRASGAPLDARPLAVDPAPIVRGLVAGDIVVVPGFTGQDDDGRTVLLGRGGSDATAVFLAHALGARCRLLKDVDGIYEADPAAAARPPRRYRTVDPRTAIAVGGGVVQPRAIELAERLGVTIEVSAPLARRATRIGNVACVLGARRARRPARTRIAILGCGVVGAGIYDVLSQLPERFEIVAVAVRDAQRPRAVRVPPGLLVEDAIEAATAYGAEIVVDALNEPAIARRAIRAALAAGADVVSAGKAVIAGFGRELLAVAHRHGRRLSWSAAVGGAVPVLEAVRRVSGGRARDLVVDGVLNATTSYLHDALHAGQSARASLIAAREVGLAEADSSADTEGHDAACKLALVHQAATGRFLDLDQIEREPTRLDPESHGALVGLRFRQRATLAIVDGRAQARVASQPLPAAHPLVSTTHASNAVLVSVAGTVERYHGRGAGAKPTATALLADILDSRRHAPRVPSLPAAALMPGR